MLDGNAACFLWFCGWVGDICSVTFMVSPVIRFSQLHRSPLRSDGSSTVSAPAPGPTIHTSAVALPAQMFAVPPKSMPAPTLKGDDDDSGEDEVMDEGVF